MSAFFSSAKLTVTSPPFTALPLSFGCWVKTTTVAAGNAVILSLWNNTSSASYGIYRESATMTIWGGATSTSIVATMVANRWYYVVFRFIATANKRLSVVDELGVLSAGQNVDTTVTAIQNWDVGWEGLTASPVNFWSGNMAEFWITDTDIQPGGGVLDNATLRQLAYYGPFSVPLVRNNLVHYRSFRSVTDDRSETPSEVFHGKYGRISWGITSGLTSGGPPPIYGGYESGRRSRRVIPF